MKKAITMHFVHPLALIPTLLAGTWACAQFPGMSQPKHYPWTDASLSPDTRADLVIKEMSLDEKIQLLHGLGWQALFAPPDSGPATHAVSVLGFILVFRGSVFPIYR